MSALRGTSGDVMSRLGRCGERRGQGLDTRARELVALDTEPVCVCARGKEGGQADG